MDHARLLSEIRSRDNLEQAFDYAIFDRTRRDFYFDYSEIEYARLNRSQVLDEIAEELRAPEAFVPRFAYAFFPPKSALCYRRMVYIPIKDLVVRYAFTIIFAKYLDPAMSPQSFANRRATGEQAKVSLLDDFSTTSWPAFCSWQKNMAASSSVLLRTDISSFYDSISHSYLLEAISGELGISPDSPVMKLFKRLLTIEVISYSVETQKTKTDTLRQGLPIGNGTEGFLANIYLNRVDASMRNLKDVKFGRYNDDMRLFGNRRAEVLNSLRLLQELLLVKGLNLNASKTMVAEDEKEMEKLRSVVEYELSGYEDTEEEEEVGGGQAAPEAQSEIKANIDQNFGEVNETFAAGQALASDKQAKLFCKFLSGKKPDGTALVPPWERLPAHAEMLGEVLGRWQGSGKHASWLLIQCAFFKGVKAATTRRAREVMFEQLENGEGSSYVKYKILHHILRTRTSKGGDSFRYLDCLSGQETRRLKELIPWFIKWPAFELNLVAIFLAKTLGSSGPELEDLVRKNAIDPDADPIRTSLSLFAMPASLTERAPVGVEEGDEEPEAEY